MINRRQRKVLPGLNVCFLALALFSPLAAIANINFSAGMNVSYSQTFGTSDTTTQYLNYAIAGTSDGGVDLTNYFPTEVSFSNSSPVFPGGTLVVSALNSSASSQGANAFYSPYSYPSLDQYGMPTVYSSLTAGFNVTSTNLADVVNPTHIAITGGLYDGQTADVAVDPSLLPSISMLSDSSYAALGQLGGTQDLLLNYSAVANVDNYFFSASDLTSGNFFYAFSNDPSVASFLMPGDFFVQDHSYVLSLQATRNVELSPGVGVGYASSNLISLSVSQVPEGGWSAFYVALAMTAMVFVHRRIRTEAAIG